MALTPSNPIVLGSKAHSFSLLDVVSNSVKSLIELSGAKGTLVLFICNHCPFVKHINSGLVDLANSYHAKGITFIAISSNDAETYPQDGPQLMKEHALKEGYPFPYLYDETQAVAKQYAAACTPDFYLYNAELVLVYHGQFDDSRPGNGIPVTGNTMREAFENLLQQKEPLLNQLASVGCNIKWKI